MNLNNILPAQGEKTKRTRVGRGHGSGLGKTCGRGHKGQKSRSGGTIARGFEGGQMPYKMRLPKFGFTSRKSLTKAEVRLGQLNKITDEIVDLVSLKKFNIINKTVENVKIFLSGEVKKAFVVRGVDVSKGALEAIQKAGGKVEK